MENKQETIEEVAERYDENKNFEVYGAFIDGAKWQQEIYCLMKLIPNKKQTIFKRY